MMEERKEQLISYIEANISPILVDFISGSDLLNTVILPANMDIKDLNGHYEGTKFLPPSWFNELKYNKILVIEKIDSISKEEQLKFCEILEYRKVSTFDLPKECVIIITVNKISKDTINEKILSLVAQIGRM